MIDPAASNLIGPGAGQIGSIPYENIARFGFVNFDSFEYDPAQHSDRSCGDAVERIEDPASLHEWEMTATLTGSSAEADEPVDNSGCAREDLFVVVCSIPGCLAEGLNQGAGHARMGRVAV